MKYKGIIFDFNGTLYWDSQLHYEAWREYSKMLRGYEFTDEEMRDKIVIASLTERHARALLLLPDNSARNRALDIIIERHLTVSESERLIKDILRRRKEPTKPPIKVFKDMRIFINTLNHAVDSIRRAGIEADTAKSETDEYFEYVVRISKPNEKPVVMETIETIEFWYILRKEFI